MSTDGKSRMSQGLSPLHNAGSPVRTVGDVYGSSIRHYQQEIATLKDEVADLQRQKSSPDRQLLRTCELLEKDKARMCEEIKTLRDESRELSMQVDQDDSLYLSDRNGKLSSALHDSQLNERKLAERSETQASKMRDMKREFREMADKYSRVLEEKRASDKQLIESMSKQSYENEEKEKMRDDVAQLTAKVTRLEAERDRSRAQVDESRESVVKVMRRYNEAKMKIGADNDRITELCEMNEKNLAKLKEYAMALKKNKSEVRRLKKENTVLEHKNEEMEDERRLLALEEAEGRAAEASAKAQNMALTAEVESLTRLCNDSREEMASLRRQLEEVEADYVGARRELEQFRAEFDGELNEARMENQRLQSQLRKTVSQSQNTKTEIQRLMSDNASLRETCRDIEEETISQEKVWKGKLDVTARENGELRRQIEAARAQNVTASEKMGTMESEFRRIRSENEVLRQSCKELEHVNGNLHGQLNVMVGEFEKALSKDDSEHDDRVSALKTLSREIDEAAKDDDLDGDLDILADLSDEDYLPGDRYNPVKDAQDPQGHEEFSDDALLSASLSEEGEIDGSFIDIRRAAADFSGSEEGEIVDCDIVQMDN